MTAITLEWYEAMQAALVGVQRQMAALYRHRREAHGASGADGWTKHIEGAAGELVVAKVTGRYWGAHVNRFRGAGPDVAGGLEVRTRSDPSYDLPVRDDDDDAAIFVLVLGQCPTYTVVGWILGLDAKRPQWRQTYGGRDAAYFVPQAHLHAMDTLVL
jgi:hypothetical protein